MRKLPDPKKASPLAVVACTIALRKSLRRHVAVYRGAPFALALVVPEETRDDFILAFIKLKASEPVLVDIGLAKEDDQRTGRRNFADIESSLREEKRLLIFLRNAAKAPAFVIAAVDKIEPVSTIDASVLMEAVKIVHEAVLNAADAERMARFSTTEVFAALRPGRKHADVLAGLEAAKQRAVDAQVPRIEELSGYGDVGDWANSLIADIRAWKDGNLPWEDVDSGVLLSGKPGVGKTLFARSLAKSSGCNFIASSLAQWQATGYLNDLLKAMRGTFELAVAAAPTILLIDEFDSLGDRTRFTGHNAQYSTEVVAALLECLDGAERREGVVVFGACNHPHMIDRALLRPGRLSKHFELPLPDIKARKGILATHLGPVLSDREAEAVASRTMGFSGADIAQLAKDARRRARSKAAVVTIDDVLEALPPMKAVEGLFRYRVCIHEASHAAVGLALNIGKLAGVSVANEISVNGGVCGGAHFEGDGRLPTKEFFLDQIATMLAGMAGEFVIFGDHLEGCGGDDGTDLDRAADVATRMVAQLGMGAAPNFFSSDNDGGVERIRRSMPRVNAEVERILSDECERAKKIVSENISFVNALAAILVIVGGVEGDRAVALFNERRTADAG